MRLVRVVLLLVLLAAAGCFALYAVSGQVRYRRYGLVLVRAVVIAGLLFFGVLIAQRLI